MEINMLTEKIIGCAIKVHRNLGPGFLESVYQAALAYELRKAEIPFEREKPLPVPYMKILSLMSDSGAIFWSIKGSLLNVNASMN